MSPYQEKDLEVILAIVKGHYHDFIPQRVEQIEKSAYNSQKTSADQ